MQNINSSEKKKYSYKENQQLDKHAATVVVAVKPPGRN